MLVKLTPGVDFTNMFTRSFYACRSQKRKILVKPSVFFVLVGSVCIKVACKMLVKLTLGSGHVTFWNLIGRDEAGLSVEQLGDRLRATEGCFMMTDIADIESVVETAVAGKVISSCHWGNLLVSCCSCSC